MHILIGTFAVNHKGFLCTFTFYFCLLPNLWATWYLHVRSVIVFILCVSACDSLSILVPLLVWTSTLFEKSDCKGAFVPKINLSFFIIAILVKLLEMIYCYITSFLVVSVIIRYMFLIIIVLCHQCLISIGPPVLLGGS